VGQLHAQDHIIYKPYLDWGVLECHRNRVAIDTSHEQPKQRADRKELLKRRRIDGGDLQQAQYQHVDHHWPLATISVTGSAEESCPDAAEQKCQGDGGRDICVGSIVVSRKLYGLD
jgi:hypothetical protein